MRKTKLEKLDYLLSKGEWVLDPIQWMLPYSPIPSQGTQTWHELFSESQVWQNIYGARMQAGPGGHEFLGGFVPWLLVSPASKFFEFVQNEQRNKEHIITNWGLPSGNLQLVTMSICNLNAGVYIYLCDKLIIYLFGTWAPGTKD